MSETWMEAGIVSNDAASLVEFLERGLGFESTGVLEFPAGQVHKLRNGRATMKVFQPADTPADRDPTTDWRQVSGFAYAALHVDDIDTVLERAEAAGATVLAPVTNHRPGAYMALFQDLQGNTWELLADS